MVSKLKEIFRSRKHQDIMLVGLFLSSIIVYISLALLAFIMQIYYIFFIKLILLFLMIALLWFYLRYFKTKLFASILIVIIEAESSLAVLNREFYEFITIYPFLIIFGFYFFFRLKTALWMTLVHLLYWTGATALKYREIQEVTFADRTPDFNMFTTSVVVIILGIFYNISTEVSYEKLEKDDRIKAFLLKEIHHRIKNNLNIITSIFGLQMLSIKKSSNLQQNPYDMLKENKVRIESIAMIHEALYKDYNMEKIDFEEYTMNLIDLINQTYSRDISVEIDSNHISLLTNRVFQLGIILNELFTNSIKYAFDSDKEEEIEISLRKEDDKYILIYHEINNNFSLLEKLTHSESLGMKLIYLTVREMDGELDISQNGGLIFRIEFI
ncbi:sensor histidine kinase [Sulfurovum sp. bin170]|uniref:sensor histidine kinase n=1 Tax=Sulfurovum sp. bin170 TaxID=2695268 RepID=UPI0013DFEE87|nr:sensor histidine kinase [Sulfurovum sp. bin170]NEW61185.1 sensor histidine kinase [Sulfurovum sp. bin170]